MIPFSSSIGEQGKLPLSSFVVAGPFADRTGLLAAGPSPPFLLLPCVFLQKCRRLKVSLNQDLDRDRPSECKLPGQVVLVFQGGGALGSYQP